ncbi:D-alanyl-D-alanine carboxypeptidase/D-alanyl-D-alanine endopeptidase [Aidingimonas lacisalsi]|uniref:D-alanyl-D-alanine carboxypeptidase/D-alanyl-D-alanine endopeptidase n=1 Tax=Aidingimonas lacisalsi TaxID=2604086 RepID=UPI0011D1AC50|nr:D-alanyl-D-alanine carboxypeptidase/D-alanyl-D-alanine-endopeptidase [Aidingimonas lacisalsi]
MVRSWVFFLSLVVPLSAMGAGFSHLSQLSAEGFDIGAQARLLDDGEVLGEIDPERQLSPASVSKVYMAAAALERWGPQHHFTSRLLSAADVDDQGHLQGDLVLEGGGDPGLTSRDLWRMVQSLHHHGIRRIDGRLVISQWRFGPVACLTQDRCDSRTRSGNSYSAQLSSAGVNHGNWCVDVMPGARAGERARIVSCSSRAPLVRVENQVDTGGASSATELYAERVTNGEGDRMVLRGTIAADETSRTVRRSSADAADQTAQTLLALIEQTGITVNGGYATSQTPPPETARVLASHDSAPLQELLLRTLNYSNNFMADVLAMNLVDNPQADLSQAGNALESFVSRLDGHGPVTLHSGSGLTPENRTSAAGVNTLLDYMYHQASLFPSFVASLQSPVNGVMRMIRRGSDTFQSNVMLKTGTLNQPFAVRSVAGYFRTEQGRWGAFSVLVNGSSTTPYLNWTKVLEPLTKDLTAMIVSH